jgi:hypothetical protein
MCFQNMQRDNFTSLSDDVLVGFCTILWLNNPVFWTNALPPCCGGLHWHRYMLTWYSEENVLVSYVKHFRKFGKSQLQRMKKRGRISPTNGSKDFQNSSFCSVTSGFMKGMSIGY